MKGEYGPKMKKRWLKEAANGGRTKRSFMWVYHCIFNDYHAEL